jgi:hypothetical protein
VVGSRLEAKVNQVDKTKIPKRWKGMIANDNWRPEPQHAEMLADLIEAGYGDLIKLSLAQNPNLTEETAVSEMHAFY